MVFILSSIILFYIIIFMMPKHITGLDMYANALFALLLVLIVDIYLGLKLDLYGYFAMGVIDWRGLIIHLGVFPAYNIIFLNFFPKVNRYKLVYILAHSLIALAYEWTTFKVGVFYYNGWLPVYSAIAYPFIFLILLWNYKLLRILKKRA
ncbi:hypothetical protein JNUCC1_01493 [Lentibacillus sp. JNUCC-1]|uniref:hypothetical protein n=1 Tax=Lentibacillus sp. JNUCC-1 TaxID=2654513 RepID=UPI001328CC71|nr:hypothetical protein [Lentibacillus sp. JNUCC-1]MUV37687.1 hypothetical protein [Lentibacillus sp. JNUCC-1]